MAKFTIDVPKLMILLRAEGLNESQFARKYFDARKERKEGETGSKISFESAKKQARRIFGGGSRYTSDEVVAAAIAQLLGVERDAFQWKNQYRVVISCHADLKRKLAGKLASDELAVDWVPINDHNENTLDRIRFAHAFVPILRPDDQPRDSAIFQIAVASELDIPVLAFSVGNTQTGVIKQTVVAPKDIAGIADSLNFDAINAEVRRCRDRRQLKAFACTKEYEHRTPLIANFAKRAAEIGLRGTVRQRGAISCFSLPRSKNHADWPIVEGAGRNVARSVPAREDQAFERMELEDKHVKHEGAELILRPLAGTRQRGPRATIRRLEILRDFLEARKRSRAVRVALPEFEQLDQHEQLINKCPEVFDAQPEKGNLLVVGDFFAADSINPRQGLGYRYTSFYTHSPTVLEFLEQFADEMEECHTKQVVFTPAEAISRIDICIQVINEFFKPD